MRTPILAWTRGYQRGWLRGDVLPERPVTAIALALLTALFCLVGWIARVGALGELLSKPILVGYMAGIAVLMVASQLDAFLGFSISGDSLAAEVHDAVRHLHETHVPTLVLALVLLAGLLIGARRWPRAPVALAGMLLATAVSSAFHLPDHGVATVGHIAAALPGVNVPELGLHAWLGLVGPALGIAFVTFTDTILAGRAFVPAGEARPDAKRELLGLGAANLGAGLLQGLPVSSSGSRTAIGQAVGGRSQLTGGLTLVVTTVAVLAGRPVLEAFPTAALGAVVVYAAAVRLVDIPEMIRFWRFRHSELVLALATAAAVLVVGVLDGIVVAIGLSVLDVLRRVARPHDAVLGHVPGLAGMHDVDDDEARPVPGLLIYRYDSPLFFANAADFHNRATASMAAYPDTRWFMLNVEAVSGIDITAADVLEELRSDLADQGVELGLARMKQDVRDLLARTGILDRIGEDRIFPTLPTAVRAFETWQDTSPR